MRAFVVTDRRSAAIVEVEAPSAGRGEVVVDVARAGVCGTDVELFTGEMAYLRQGHARYPLRPGHEWCGTVTAIGDEVDPAWLGQRVVGDTEIGCGRCRRCLTGRHWLCDDRSEIGIRRGFPGALAEQLVVPAASLFVLPDTIDDTAGALVEPGGNALRAVRAGDLSPGERVLVVGLGTIGLLAASFARSLGAEVHGLGHSQRSMDFARTRELEGVWRSDDLPDLPWHVVIDASNAPDIPAHALELVEPGGRIVLIGLAGTPSQIDTRSLVLKDVTAVGVLAASSGLAGTIEAYASGTVDPRPLVAATVGLSRVTEVLGGWRPGDAGSGPKILVDPQA